MVRVLVLLAAIAALAGCGGGHDASSSAPPAALLHPAQLHRQAPAVFDATFKTTAGTFVVTAHRAWAARGVDRFYNLVRNGFFDGAKFFRVVPRFVAQFGISPYPDVSAAWQQATIADDPSGSHTNGRGTVTFASAGPNSRTTQLFINLQANPQLDAQGFTPIGSVTSGMDVVDELYSGYGDAPTAHQGEMMQQGNAYLEKTWPKLDGIETATISHVSN